MSEELSALDHLKGRLNAIRSGPVEALPWLTDLIIARLLLNAHTQPAPPRNQHLWGFCPPFHCHAEALHPTLHGVPIKYTTPFFGFAFFDDNMWWGHSWNWHGDFLIDPCRKPPTMFWGMPWNQWLFDALFPGEELPQILCQNVVNTVNAVNIVRRMEGERVGMCTQRQ